MQSPGPKCKSSVRSCRDPSWIRADRGVGLASITLVPVGTFRAVLATLLLAVGIAACGSSAPRPPAPDRIALERIDGLLSALTQLQGEINLAPQVRDQSAYAQSEGPLIDQFGRTSRQLGRWIVSLRDAQAAKIYSPLGTAIAQAAKDMRVFLNFVIAHDATSIKRGYTRLINDEKLINQVALAQFPKARAYAQKAAG